MRAVVMRSFGSPEVLVHDEVPTPQPGDGEVLIRVHSVSVNRTLDLTVRAGRSPFQVALPHVLGTDPAGVVAAIGPGVTKVQEGDRVTVVSAVRCDECEGCRAKRMCRKVRHIGVESWGGYAEYVVVPELQTHPIPQGVDFAEATYVTRHFGMAEGQIRTSGVQAGQTALVMGAAGSLGAMLVQLLKRRGVAVIGAAGADDRVGHVRDLGADLGINYRAQDLAAEVRTFTGGRGAEVVFENIGDPELFGKAFESLAFEGVMVTAGFHGGGTVPLDVRRLHLQQLSVLASNARFDALGHDKHDFIADGLELLAAGEIRAFIGARMPLAEAVQAHRLIERREVPGKLVLLP